MKHIIIGGEGFTGRILTQRLAAAGKQVLVCDIGRGATQSDHQAAFERVDIRDMTSVRTVALGPDDVVYHLAARQYHERVPAKRRDAYFDEVNVAGTRNILAHMAASGCHRMVFFSTDMVYGLPQAIPVERNHQRSPLGPYGASKRKAEDLCMASRRDGMSITILRPRLILGPGRLGVLQTLFNLIRRGLPVPLIGNGANQYQMVSVFDCADAAVCAVDAGLPNAEYNLGSKNPPSSRSLLQELIDAVGSRSLLVSTPARPMKALLSVLDAIGLTVLYPEQFLIADRNYLVDTRATEQELGWVAKFNDYEMMMEAFREYVALKRPLAQRA
jgi:dTDP-glucose 4,6-dehydratase